MVVKAVVVVVVVDGARGGAGGGGAFRGEVDSSDTGALDWRSSCLPSSMSLLRSSGLPLLLNFVIAA